MNHQWMIDVALYEASCSLEREQADLDTLVLERMTYPRAEYVVALRQALGNVTAARARYALIAGWSPAREPFPY